MSSVQEHSEIVSQYITAEVAAGRLRPAPVAQLSPIGLTPKKNRPDAFRMIVDLSSPKGQSVNDGNRPRGLLVPLFLSRGCGTEDGQVRPRRMDGQAGPKVSILDGPCPPRG